MTTMGQQVWEISSKRSFLHFRVSYFQISNITGSFLRFAGRVFAEEGFVHPRVELRVETQSVETFDPRRNAKLRSAEFLASVRFPYMEFSSANGCKESGGTIRELTGQLTVKGMVQEIVLLVNFAEIRINRKKPMAFFRLFGTISRQAFGLAGATEEEIGDAIHLHADVYMILLGQP
jgi:polyisoprenoid-binding protein YceI